MGMFTDLHKLDQDQQDEATVAAQTKRPTAPPAIGAPDRLRPQGADRPADAASTAMTETPARATKRTAKPASPQEEHPVPSLDLGELPYRKDTFLFTDGEFESLDDLKLAMRRALDVRVTKNDLARCAIAYMVEDCRRHGAASPVIAPLKRKGGR